MALGALLAACMTATASRPPPVAAPAPQVAPAPEPPGPRAAAFLAFFEDSVRLHRMAARLRRAGAALCGEQVRATAGLAFATLYDFPREWRDAAQSAVGLGERPRLLSVSPGSPAERAGLTAGDEIYAVAGRRVAGGPEATRATARLLKTRLLETVANGPFALTVGGGDLRTVPVSPDRVCDVSVVLGEDESPDARADGDRIMVTRGMLRLFPDDDRLAWVLAHALAHNALHRTPTSRIVVPGRGLAAAMARAFADAYETTEDDPSGESGERVARTFYSEEFEAEADYAAVYLLARGGFRYRAAPELAWQVMAALPSSSEMLRAHPVWPTRFARVEEAVAEIDTKRTAGSDLEPDFELAAVADAGRERERALFREQTAAVLAGAGKFMTHFGANGARVSIKGPREVAIVVADGLAGQSQYLAGALCASIKGQAELVAGPIDITVGEAGTGKDPARFPCE